MNKLKALAYTLFVISISIIIGSICGLTEIYYWCIRPDCFAIWASVMGIIIKIGETP